MDKRSDGEPTAADEIATVVSGNVNITGNAPNWSVALDLTLQDGTSMTGTCTGSFYEIPGLN